MIAEPKERRSSKRFTVEADRADVVVEFGGESMGIEGGIAGLLWQRF